MPLLLKISAVPIIESAIGIGLITVLTTGIGIGKHHPITRPTDAHEQLNHVDLYSVNNAQLRMHVLCVGTVGAGHGE